MKGLVNETFTLSNIVFEIKIGEASVEDQTLQKFKALVKDPNKRVQVVKIWQRTFRGNVKETLRSNWIPF